MLFLSNHSFNSAIFYKILNRCAFSMVNTIPCGIRATWNMSRSEQTQFCRDHFKKYISKSERLDLSCWFCCFCFIQNHSSLESLIPGRAHVTFSQSGAKWPVFGCPLFCGDWLKYILITIFKTGVILCEPPFFIAGKWSVYLKVL